MNEKDLISEITLLKAERERVFAFIEHVMSKNMYSQATVQCDVDSEWFSDSCKYVDLITQLRTLRDYLKTSAMLSALYINLYKKTESED